LLADGTFNSVLARNKAVKHRHVVTRPDAKPSRDGEQKTLPSYGNPMPAR
jgi:hypothetical protein